jgi:uncharacterized LabA/DUF88 family protein
MQVFIDGENLRHRLVEVLYGEHLLHESDDWFELDVRQLVTDALGESPDTISFYTTRIKQPNFEIPELLQRKITDIQESHRRWIAMLTNQGIRVVKAGNLKVHSNAPCYHCGRRTMVLQEKGVDVRMASEMVMAAVHDGEKDIVVMSSDADMIPALDIARRAGARITYFCFSEEVNNGLTRSTDRVLTYDRPHILKAFRGVLPRKTDSAGRTGQAAHEN